jgi:DNA-binding beta-propeller fold protein YncE
MWELDAPPLGALADRSIARFFAADGNDMATTRVHTTDRRGTTMRRVLGLKTFFGGIVLSGILGAGIVIAGVAGHAATNPVARPAAVPAVPASAVGPSGYHLLKTVPIPGDSFWDYMTFEPGTNRLFITHGNHVVVVNVATDKIIGNIGGMKAIHGVVLAPEFNRGFVTDGGAAKLWVFNLKTLKVIGSAPTDPDADGDVSDPYSKRVFTFNGGSHTSTVVDAKTMKVVGRIELGGDPEFPVADGRGHVYDNITSTSQIVEIDSRTLKITHRWSLAPGQHPSGLAIDAQHRILFSGCHNGLMVIMNADTGKVITTEPIGQGVDAVRFDPGTGYAFASNGGSADLTVIHEDSPTKFHVVENVKTEQGARTMALDPANHEVFLVTGKRQAIPNPPPNAPFYEKFRIVSFHLLVYGR